jgi:protein-tyrosine phosphatase
VIEQFKIMVVCLGNVCRSPLAERLLRTRFDELLGDRGSTASISSAGVRAMVASPMDDLAAAELIRLGGSPGGFAARQLSGDLTRSADLVLTATRDIRSRVLEEAPTALKRTFTIRELAALLSTDTLGRAPVADPAGLVARAASWRGSTTVEDYDVPDPIGRPAEFHRAVAELLDADTRVIAQGIVGAILSDLSPR